jgi:hypothetical protein
MTRRIPPRSGVASGDPELARLATVDLAASPLNALGLGRSWSLRGLGRTLFPNASLAFAADRAVISDRIRGFRRGR